MIPYSEQKLTALRSLIWGARGRRFKSYRPDQNSQLGQTLMGGLPFFVFDQLKTNSIETQNPVSIPAHPDDDRHMSGCTAPALAGRTVERLVNLAALLPNTL